MNRFLILLFLVFSLCSSLRAEALKRALLVGVDEYEDSQMSKLWTTTNDVNDLAERIQEIGFQKENIVILSSAMTNPKLRPSRQNILKQMREICKACGEEDVLLIVLSGHGLERGSKSYFCPEDVDIDSLPETGINVGECVQDLVNCQAIFKWVIVDACRETAYKGVGHNFHLAEPPKGVALFQSCSSGEFSRQAEKHGLFMKHILAALNAENADANHDGGLSFHEICEYAILKTRQESANYQNPTLDYKGELKDFILLEDYKRPEAEKAWQEARTLRKAGKYGDAWIAIQQALANFNEDERYLDEQELLLEKLKNSPTSRDSFEWDGTKIKKFIGKETIVVIPEGVTEIGGHAFQCCRSLTSVVIPEGVTKIGRSAFDDCSSLTSVVIPEGVTTIGEWAFDDCSSLTSVVIPEGVTEIGEWAFSGCSSLTSVVIPDSVQKIGGGAFTGCTALKQWSISSIHPYFKTDGVGLLTKDGKKLIACLGTATEYRIPEGVTEIGNWAFSDCRSLTSVVIPESVTEIKGQAFSDCSSLTSVVIPEGVTEIGDWAFYGCSSLTSVVIPDSVTTIGKNTFNGCHSLTSVVIPKAVTKIENWVFGGCSSLTSVAIPEKVTEIGEGAFADCRSLTSVKLPESVTVIGAIAFGGCISLKSVNIPDSVQEIDRGAFAGCIAMKQWSIASTQPYFKSDGTGLLTKDGKKLVACLTSATEYRIPEDVTAIGVRAFWYCNSLASVVIPEGVTEIGFQAFEGCSSLKSVEIPKGVTRIESDTFKNCLVLTSVVIPEGVTAIEDNAFQGCSSLTSVEIPKGVTVIKSGAFAGCRSLKSVEIPEGVERLECATFSDCSSLTSVIIPNGMKAIVYGTFQFCHSLKSVVLPEGLVAITDCVFSNCKSLTSIVIPESVKVIHPSAFYGCSGLKEWKLAENNPNYKVEGPLLMTKDGKSVIRCLNVESVTIPDSVMEINEAAFIGCSNLKEWKLAENNPNYKVEGPLLMTKDGKSVIACLNVESVTIPDSVTEIDVLLFVGYTKIKEWHIPDSLPNIQAKGPALFSKDGTKLLLWPGASGDVTIPEGVTEIGRSAFSGCSSLTSVVIPDGVTVIGEHAFYGCSSLTSVVIPESVTEFGEWYPFSACPKLTIHAPQGSKAEEYAKANNIPFKAL